MITKMEGRILFPVYVCLDDGTIERIEELDSILVELEAIDIKNDEYMFWDAAGNGFKILIDKGKVSGFKKAENEITLQQAFAAYAQQLTALGATVKYQRNAGRNLERSAESSEFPATHAGFLRVAFSQEEEIVA